MTSVVPSDVCIDHALQDVVEHGRICLAPQAAGVAKAIDLVVGVVIRRKILSTAGDSCIRNAVPMLDAGRAKLDVIPRIRFLDADVVHYMHALLLGFVHHRRHQITVHRVCFDAFETLSF